MHKIKYIDGLPSYFGGKRKLASWIFDSLTKHVPKQEWQSLGFLDAFSGGGSMSLSAKLLGFDKVMTNDKSYRSYLINTGLIHNQYQKLPIETAYKMVLHRSAEKSFVREQFAGSVFDTYRSTHFDEALDYIQHVDDPVTQAQLKLLLWREVSRSVVFGTSIGSSNRPYAEALDGKRNYASLPEKRLRDKSFAKLLSPCWSSIDRDVESLNNSIFPANGRIRMYQEDVFELLPKITTDILYADPPYGCTFGYENAIQVLDAVLLGSLPEPEASSVFSSSLNALSQLFDLAHHIPVWVLSYNDKLTSLDELVTLIQAVDPSRNVMGYSKAYKHLSHVAKRDNNELLVIASK